MSKFSVNLTANTGGNGTFVCHCKKKRDNPSYKYTIMAYGTFGSGTLTWYVSPDQGATVIAMTDLTDTALSMTSNKMFDGELGGVSSKNSDVLSIYVQLSGSTSPSITAAVYDNNA